MFTITSTGQIQLTRGDTCVLPIQINQGTSMDPVKYELGINDTAYFALMEPNQPFEEAILKKTFLYSNTIDGNIVLELNPSDTMCLLPGLYYYQIKVRIYDEDSNTFIVNTIIPKTQFWIME